MNDRAALRRVQWVQLCLTLLCSPVLADALIFEERFESLQAVQANGGTAGSAGWLNLVAGISGTGADFSGNKLVCYPLAGRLQPSAGTVELWVKMPPGNGLGLFDIGGLGNANSWGIFKNADHLIMEVKSQYNSFSQAWSPAPLAPDNDWHLITAVWTLDGATTRFKICFDGQCKSAYDGSRADSYPNLNGSMCIGWTGWYGYSQSIVDELRIYDYAKTSTQVLAAFAAFGADTTGPEIRLVGPRTVVLDTRSVYTDQGATAADFRDGDLTSHIVKRGDVDTTRPGAYRIAYNVTDTAGNPGREALRTVYVVDHSAHPVVRAYAHLIDAMDRCSDVFFVHDDFLSGCNHAVASGWEGGIANIELDEAWRSNCFSGVTCWKNSWSYTSPGWAGVRWLQPESNFGQVANAGYDLTGAVALRFAARAAGSAASVEFFAGGVTGAFPDSLNPAASTGVIALTPEWREYEIDLSSPSMNLSKVISPFGWTVTGDATFHVDAVRYVLKRPNSRRLLPSFDIFNLDTEAPLANVAYTHDNALAAIAFLASDAPEDRQRARILVDTFIFAMENDRAYTDGRLRNAYMFGDIADPIPRTAKLPGWWDIDARRWYEDEFAVSTHTGNIAWAMLALLAAYDQFGSQQYLDAAIRLGEWVERETRDSRGRGGYTGGFQGWEASAANPAGPGKLLYKATEHNIDLFPAFQRLYQATNEQKWLNAAEHARRFVASMWDPVAKHFWTGTLNDGVSANMANIPLDIHPWAVLAFPEETAYREGLTWATENMAVDADGFSGFDFNSDLDGIWPEGTAQMAVALELGARDSAKSSFYVSQLRAMQLGAENANGKGMVAASHDHLTTGFDSEYFSRLHVGATAWYIFAEKSINPYWRLSSAPPAPAPSGGKRSGGGGAFVPLCLLFLGLLVAVRGFTHRGSA